jgi:arylsulfatase A-like enzyme
MVAFTEGRWRLIYRAQTPNRSELYDKWEDPQELSDMAKDHPEILEDLRAKIDAYLESRPPPWGEDAPSVEIDEMEMNQLRAIGYGVQ